MTAKKTTHIFFIGILVVVSFFFIQRHVQAENGEPEEKEEYKSPSTVISTNPGEKKPKKTETVTKYIRLSDTITKVVTTITQYDSDGDGIYDEDDPHPTINEYFIVKDDNLNGIDDRYEQHSDTP